MLAILLLVVGCQEQPPTQAIHVGMPLEEAKEIMAKAGAEEGIFFSMMPEVPPEGPEPVVVNFRFPDGPGLYVIAELAEESAQLLIKSIDVCNDPEVPKLDREWRPVETFTP